MGKRSTAITGAHCSARDRNSFALRPIAYCVMLACCDLTSANPTGPQVIQGNVQIQGLGSSNLKVTNSPGSIIHWQGFSIGAGQATQFVQQSASSAVLNRVVGADISQINGQLLSNGRVFLINPAGIVVGAGGVIDTAGFVGSTLNMTNADFLAGKLRFSGDASAGSVVNHGWIRAGQGGNIVLVAPHVENSGIVQTEGGQIVLAAGQKMTIGSVDLEGVQFEIQAPTDSALNVGKLLADGGAVGVFAGTLKHSGDIRANAMTRDEAGRIVLRAKEDVTLTAGSTLQSNGKTGGRITVQSQTGTTLVSGAIEAKGSAGKGGALQVLGDRVGLLDTAVIDASGETGGGQILVGGDYRGSNPDVLNAWRTLVAPQATVRADAVGAGDGGKIIVWSEDATAYYGHLSARGGAQSGNGGFMEVSGKRHLDFRGTVDARAPHGTFGTLLLDPTDITIVTTVPVNDVEQFNQSFGTDTVRTYFEGSGPPTSSSELQITRLATALASVSGINITTNSTAGGSGDITMNAALDISGIGLTGTGAAKTLRFVADRNININSPITNNSGTDILNLTLQPGQTTAGASYIRASLALGGGTLDARTGSTGVVNIDSGSPVIDAIFNVNTLNLNGGNATFNRTVNAATAVNVSAGTSTFTGQLANSGTLSVSGGTVNFNAVNSTMAGVTTISGGVIGGTGRLTLDGNNNQWTGGRMEGTGETLVTAGNSLAISGSNNKFLTQRTLTTNGPVTWSGAGIIGAGDGGTFNNNAGFDIQGNQTWSNSFTTGNPTTINNTGGITRSSGTGTAALDRAIVTGSGAITLATGTGPLKLSGNGVAASDTGTLSGTITLNDATLEFAGGTYNVTRGITGTGTLAVSGGTLASTGTLNVGTLNVSGGAATFSSVATLNVTNDVAVSSGSATFSSDTTIGRDLNVSSGSATFDAPAAVAGKLLLSDGVLGGSGTITVNGLSSVWSGGDLSGSGTLVFATVPPALQNNLTLSGPATSLRLLGGYSIENFGTVASGGDGGLVADGASVITNHRTWNIFGSWAFGATGGGTPSFDNLAGANINAVGGAGALTTFNVQFNNAGTLRINANDTVALGGGGTSTGAFNLFANTSTLEFSGGTHNLNAGSSVFGPGTALFSGATVNVNDAYSATTTTITNGAANFNGTTAATTANLNVSGGALGGSGAFNVSGPFAWTGPGQVSGTGTLTTAGATTITGPAAAVLDKPWLNNGDVTFAAGGQLSFISDVTLTNSASGTINLDNAASQAIHSTVGFARVLDNFGTISKGTTGLQFINGNVIVNNRHDVNVTAGTLRIDGGGTDISPYNVAASAALEFAGGTRNFNAGANVTGGGALTISGGTFNFNTPFTFGNSFTLGATLGGTANVTLNGPFIWTGGQVTGTGLLTTNNTTTLGPAVTVLDKNWTNNGDVTFAAGGQLSFISDVTLTNNANGTITLDNANGQAIHSTIGFNRVLDNFGTINKGSTGVQFINGNVIVNNHRDVTVTAGTLRIDGSGTDDSPYNVGAAASLEFGGGTRNFNAGANVTGGGSLAISGGTFNFNTPFTFGNPFTLNATLGGASNVTLNGPFIWTGGQVTGTGTLTTNGTTTLGPTLTILDRNWTNNGTVNFAAGGQLSFISDGLTLTNSATGTINLDNAAGQAIHSTIGFNRGIDNFGAINKGSGGLQFINGNITLDNTGSINVTAGTLRLDNLPDNPGTLNVGAGATISTNGANLANNGSITGSGIIDLGGATLTNNGTLRPGANIGTLTVQGNLTQGAAGRVAVELGGSAAGEFDVLAVTGTANLRGTLDVAKANGYSPEANKTFTVLTAPVVAGTFSTVTKHFGRSLSTSYSPNVVLTTGNTIVNSWELNASGDWSNGANWIEGHAPQADEQVLIDQPGALTITIPAGNFTVQSLTSNENISIAGGSLSLANASTINGTLGVSGGALQGAGPLAVNGNLLFTGGTIANTGGVNVTGTTAVNGGTPQLAGSLLTNGFNMSGGTLAISSGGTLTLAGPLATTIGGATLNNAGTMRLTGANDLGLNNGATLNNTGTFDLQTNAGIGHTAGAAGTLINAGVLLKSAGGGTSAIDGVSLSNPGRIDLRNGTLAVNGGFPVNAGTIVVAGGTTFSTNRAPLTNTGFIGGNGTIDLAGAQLSNDGTVAPGASPGRLTILGDYTQGPGGVLAVELAGLAPGVTYDLLQIAGTANLDGTMNVVSTAGFVPAAGNTFGVMTYANRVGDFARMTYSGGGAVHPVPGASSYVLAEGAPAPRQVASPDVLRNRSMEENERLRENFVDLTTTNAMEDPKGTRREICR